LSPGASIFVEMEIEEENASGPGCPTRRCNEERSKAVLEMGRFE